jgi:zinc transport system substrate-binding protein
MLCNILKILCFGFIVGFVAIPNASAIDKIGVFVSIVPQKFFVEQIGKDLVDVHVMVKPGADPHIYEAKPQQMVAISKSQLYFAIGIEFEKANLKKIVSTNPKMKVIHTDHGIEKLAMAAHHHHDDAGGYHEGEHHKEGDRDHEKGENHGAAEHKKDHHEQIGLDPHIWLSPPLVMVQARNILTALQEADPAHHAVYEVNYKAFITMLVDLDGELRSVFAGKQGLQFMVFHPAWGYFAHAYGLKQVPVEIEGKEPKPVQLKELIQHARENKIKVVFVQPQFSTKSAKLVAREIGGQVAFADPLAEDWKANLQEVADKFQSALK